MLIRILSPSFWRQFWVHVSLFFIFCGTWWRIGRVETFRTEGRGFESRSIRVGSGGARSLHQQLSLSLLESIPLVAYLCFFSCGKASLKQIIINYKYCYKISSWKGIDRSWKGMDRSFVASVRAVKISWYVTLLLPLLIARVEVFLPVHLRWHALVWCRHCTYIGPLSSP